MTSGSVSKQKAATQSIKKEKGAKASSKKKKNSKSSKTKPPENFEYLNPQPELDDADIDLRVGPTSQLSTSSMLLPPVMSRDPTQTQVVALSEAYASGDSTWHEQATAERLRHSMREKVEETLAKSIDAASHEDAKRVRLLSESLQVRARDALAQSNTPLTLEAILDKNERQALPDVSRAFDKLSESMCDILGRQIDRIASNKTGDAIRKGLEQSLRTSAPDPPKLSIPEIEDALRPPKEPYERCCIRGSNCLFITHVETLALKSLLRNIKPLPAREYLTPAQTAQCRRSQVPPREPCGTCFVCAAHVTARMQNAAFAMAKGSLTSDAGHVAKGNHVRPFYCVEVGFSGFVRGVCIPVGKGTGLYVLDINEGVFDLSLDESRNVVSLRIRDSAKGQQAF